MICDAEFHFLDFSLNKLTCCVDYSCDGDNVVVIVTSISKINSVMFYVKRGTSFVMHMSSSLFLFVIFAYVIFIWSCLVHVEIIARARVR